MVTPKQLSFFATPENKNNHALPEHIVEWQLYVDGASRNNPGIAGAGIFVTKNNIPCYKQGFFLGIKTNNQAEYIACILGMYVLEQVLEYQKTDSLTMFSDSLLLVQQLSGIYKVRHPNIIPLHAYAARCMNSLKAKVSHVMREQNIQADEAANSGIDKRTPLPTDFLHLMNVHEIII